MGVADENDGSASAGEAASGGQSTGAQAPDPAARIAELERKLAQATGRAGSTQADLTAQLAEAKTNFATEKARADAVSRKLVERDVLDEVLHAAPAATRKAVRMVAASMLEKQATLTPDADGTFATAAKAIVERITADAPELFKPAAGSHTTTTPHVDAGAPPKGGVLVINGTTIF